MGWKADTRAMRRVIDSTRRRDPAKLPIIADGWFMTALDERNANEVEAALAALGEGTFGTNAMQFNRKFGEGLLARMTRDDARAHAAFMAARGSRKKWLKPSPTLALPGACLGSLTPR